ncbi:hypothetical protein ACTU6V_04675 [Microbacterium sp. A204]|uniref:hypothetical protein n=1 Tax=Microbacterium sp. A204 TaxID=3457321 RepID=UPI003FD4EBAD
MSCRSESTAPPLFAAAAVSYAANCALGAVVAARLVDSSGFRWLHHALYIATCASVVAAIGAGLVGMGAWGDRREAGRRAALALMPAAVPLTVIAFVGARTRWHPLIALSAAPFIAAGLVCSRADSHRK